MRMRSVAPIRTAKIGYLILSAALCVFGALLIARPQLSASVLGTVCGILFVIFGIMRVMSYFSKDLYRLAFQYDLVFGILLTVSGVVILVYPEWLMTFFCVALGLYTLADGLFKVRISLDSKRFGLPEWWLILIFSLISAVSGTILMFRPGAGTQILMSLLGITLLGEGVLNFVTVLTAVKIIRHQRPDVVEVEDADIR